MIGFVALALPALVSAVAVFLLSFVLHMLLPWHRSDYGRVPREDELMDAVRPLAIPQGDYLVPRPTGPQEMRSPEFKAKLERGPVMVLTVWPNGSTSMARNLVSWFLFSFVISFIAGHIADRVLGVNPDRYLVLHTVGLATFLGYVGGLWQMSIWYRRKWSTTIKATVDGAIYAAVTGFIFCSMWPSA